MRYYSIGQVSKLLGVSVDRVRAWEKQGKIRCIRLPSGHRRDPDRKQAEAGNLRRQKERLLAHAALNGARGGRTVRKRFQEWMKDAGAEARGHESHDLRGVVPGDGGTPPV